MEIKNLAGGIIAIVLAAVLFASILVPVVGDASVETRTNTGYNYTATKTLGDYEYTVVDGALNVNGTPLNYTAGGDMRPGVSSAVTGMSYIGGSATTMWAEGQGVGTKTSSTSYEVNADGSWEFKDSNGTYSSSSDTKITDGIFAKNGGELAVYETSGAVTPIVKTSEGKPVLIYCNYGQCIDGDSATWALAFRASAIGETITIEYAYVYNNSTVVDVKDLLTVTFSSITSISTSDGETTYNNLHVDKALTGYSVQASVTAAAPLNYTVPNEMSTLLSVIPIMVVIGLVIATISIIRARE